jgi:S1-C subfamily serine protease
LKKPSFRGSIFAIGPIVYRLGHILFKDGSAVRFRVGSQNLNAILWKIIMSKRVTLSLAWHVVVVVIVILAFLTIGIAVGGYKLYQRIVLTEIQQKELTRLQEEEAKKVIASQQEALEKTQNELTKTKSDAEKTNAQIKTLSQTLAEQSKIQKEIIISSSDLAPYATGVVQVICASAGGAISSGSGSLWTFKEVPYAVVTNYHVVKGATKCVVSMTNNANGVTGIFSVSGSIYTFNANTDAAILTVGSPISDTMLPVANYNYSLAKVRKCTTLVPVGSPVVIIGFPAYAKRDSTLTIDTLGTVNVIYRTTTNGIISGYDTSQPGEANYFVSAKIDNGNSGGIALAKDANGICTLGLPTWLTLGNYETQGLVQNILNVLPDNR